ncbi:MAG TPA: hypothetical protein VK308_08660 [Pyrinomonadaceae bacterium]|nr:hypothetical protein [Pyrinomonadaceae bacterium]
MKIIILILSFFGLLLLAQIDVYACKCVSIPQTLEQEIKGRLKTSKAAFSGEVLKISQTSQRGNVTGLDVTVKMRLKQVWKGQLAKQVIINTSDNSAACGYSFEAGKSYLVFAHSSNDKILATGLCSGNRPLETAGEELKILGKGRKPKKRKF